MTNAGRRVLVLAAATLVLAAAAGAQEKGEEVQGVVTAFGPGTMTVRTAGRGDVTVHIARRTHVILSNGNAVSVDDLKEGMEVRFKFDTDVLDRVHLVSGDVGTREAGRALKEAKGGALHPEGQATAPAREMKVRVLSADGRKGELRVDVAGRPETFRADDRALLRRALPGRLVVLKVQGDTVVGLESAALSGKLLSVDRGRGEVRIDVDGRAETYGVEDRDMLRRLRPGERVTFEVEERADGRRVVTRID